MRTNRVLRRGGQYVGMITIGMVMLRTDGANAVILHDHHTTEANPGAGTAGSKLACLNVDF